ncbi:MAG: helix-turn-helix transcriptional regulator [Rhizorhabdus sp.]
MNADTTAKKLTESQRAYLRLVLAHQSSKQIAQTFGISAHTVDKRIKEAMRILGVDTRIEAARILASEEGNPARRELGPQSPDLAQTLVLPPSSVTGDIGHGISTTSSGVTLREDLAGYGASHRHAAGIPLPIPTQDRPTNTLSILQRAGWMIGLIIGLAIATGILLSGLSALSTLLLALKN